MSQDQYSQPLFAQAKAAAFTLVELITVVSVISVILALAIPTAGLMRENAKTTECITRLRQVGMAAFVHAEENNGKLTVYSIVYTPKYDEWTWITPLKRGKYIEDDQAFFCPALPPRKPITQSMGFGVRSFNELKNSHPEIVMDLRAESEGQKSGPVYINLHRIEERSTFILWADSVFPKSHGKYAEEQSTALNSDVRGGATSGTHLRHRGGANVMFADGHLQTVQSDELRIYGFKSGFDKIVSPVEF